MVAGMSFTLAYIITFNFWVAQQALSVGHQSGGIGCIGMLLNFVAFGEFVYASNS